jgi:hypothetical protein
MGKAIVYAVMGLITIGLVVVAGVSIKAMLVMFLGRKKKREATSAHWRCHHPGCTGHDPGGVQQHD